MVRLAFYFAFGILFHVLFLGPHFDPSNLWSWLWLLCWPIALFMTLGVLAAVLFACGAGMAWWMGRRA